MFICAECGKKVSQKHFNNLIIMPFLKSLILEKKFGGWYQKNLCLREYTLSILGRYTQTFLLILQFKNGS